MTARPVDVEVVLLGLDRDRRLGWRALRAPLDGSHPDDAALALAGDVGPVCHSTSWRVDGDVVVLTYAVLHGGPVPDAEPLERPSVVCSTDALRPTPAVLHGHHVAAHAVRHLSDLLLRDPVVAQALADEPALAQALHDAARAMPVAPHDDAHRLAAQAHQPDVPGGPLNGPTTSPVTQPP